MALFRVSSPYHLSFFTQLNILKTNHHSGFTKSIFRELYAETLFFEEIPAFAPVASWVTNNQQERPHIMLTLRHEATVDERLLRGELLTIVAAMNRRLSFRYFRRHAVAPVRMKSF